MDRRFNHALLFVSLYLPISVKQAQVHFLTSQSQMFGASGQ